MFVDLHETIRLALRTTYCFPCIACAYCIHALMVSRHCLPPVSSFQGWYLIVWITIQLQQCSTCIALCPPVGDRLWSSCNIFSFKILMTRVGNCCFIILAATWISVGEVSILFVCFLFTKERITYSPAWDACAHARRELATWNLVWLPKRLSKWAVSPRQDLFFGSLF